MSNKLPILFFMFFICVFTLNTDNSWGTMIEQKYIISIMIILFVFILKTFMSTTAVLLHSFFTSILALSIYSSWDAMIGWDFIILTIALLFVFLSDVWRYNRLLYWFYCIVVTGWNLSYGLDNFSINWIWYLIAARFVRFTFFCTNEERHLFWTSMAIGMVWHEYFTYHRKK